MSIKKITNSEYHKDKSISHSLIVKAKQCVMDAYLKSPFNPDYVAEDESDALVYGQLYHSLVRNPVIVEKSAEYLDSFRDAKETYEQAKKEKRSALTPCVRIAYDEGNIYVSEFGLSRRNKAYTELKISLQCREDDLIVSADEFQQACEAVRCLLAHPIYNSVHNGAQVVGDEIAIFQDIDGTPHRCKLDRLLKRGNQYIILDWKSTKETSLNTIQSCGHKLGYDIQNELYRRMVAMEYGVPFEQTSMIFVFQSKEYPLLVYALEFPPESVSQAKLNREIAVADFVDRLNRGTGLAGFVPLQEEILKFRHYENPLTEYVPIN